MLTPQQRQILSDEQFARELQQRASQAAELKEEKVTTLYVFEDDEIVTIKKRFEALGNFTYGKLMQEVVSSALEDQSIKFDWMKNPVFIKGDGDVLDKATALEMCHEKLPSPRAQKSFTEEDIIPCNPLIATMLQWVTNIESSPNAPVALANIRLAGGPSGNPIEILYQHLPRPVQQLLDLLCRDRISKALLQHPVFLPDGYVYEKAFVEGLLADSGGKRLYCPGSYIPFTKADVTPCYFVHTILAKLAELAQKFTVTSAVSAASAPTSAMLSADASVSSASAFNRPASIGSQNIFRGAAVAASAPSVDEIKSESNSVLALIPVADEAIRQDLLARLQDLSTYFLNVKTPWRQEALFKKITLSRPETINSDMTAVLAAAINALNTLDVGVLTYAKGAYPDFAKVITFKDSWTGSESSLANSGWAKFAKKMGTVKCQPGWHVYGMVKEVEKFLAELAPKIKLHASKPS